ncbi:MAG: FtsX-like permease family protein [Gemmatimonadetes bacterium]|nr:FtsX-like permease family protein [Gemmatimonadota bacterium]MDE3259624.1 FtsX-like permease family protein [Gemmatimonadota bacterium]
MDCNFQELSHRRDPQFAAAQSLFIVRVLSYISIFVACLGLLGLVAFTAERRTKEIGIRKVLGASVADVVLLLGRSILRLILVANLVALPVAYFFWQRWLENFAYRTQLGMEIFVLSGGSIVFIALVTICYHALRAAAANPIEALRYE